MWSARTIEEWDEAAKESREALRFAIRQAAEGRALGRRADEFAQLAALELTRSGYGHLRARHLPSEPNYLETTSRVRTQLKALSRTLDNIGFVERFSLSPNLDEMLQQAKNLNLVQSHHTEEQWRHALLTWTEVVQAVAAAWAAAEVERASSTPMTRSRDQRSRFVVGILALAWERVTARTPSCSNERSPFYRVVSAAWIHLWQKEDPPSPGTVRKIME